MQDWIEALIPQRFLYGLPYTYRHRSERHVEKEATMRVYGLTRRLAVRKLLKLAKSYDQNVVKIHAGRDDTTILYCKPNASAPADVQTTN